MLDCARADLCQPLHIKPYRTLNMPLLYAGKYEKILYCLIYTSEKGKWNLPPLITRHTPFWIIGLEGHSFMHPTRNMEFVQVK